MVRNEPRNILKREYSKRVCSCLAKFVTEKVDIQNENQTLASITFQNYFRLYPKLAGMTGTAATEADEFADIYHLEVLEIPTNVDIRRADEDDEVYRTLAEKDNAIVELITDCIKRGQPALVGTVSIERSEYLSELLKKNKIKHQVLNARYHEQEAQIIAQAGRFSAITIATNMAGRGTDIQLGGNADMRIAEETDKLKDEAAKIRASEKVVAEISAEKAKVIESGGLYIIGTERHESRRIDNQLRGRSGRQGDPGQSIFFLSLEDDLMRIFGSERMDTILRKLGLEEGEAIVHPWINKALEKAQQKVEARNYEIRKNLLKYDDVMNDQRKVIYEQRLELMSAEDVSETITDMRHEVIEDQVAVCIPPKAYPEQWDTTSLTQQIKSIFDLNLPIADWANEEGIAEEGILERITSAADQKMAERAANFGPELMRMIEQNMLLNVLDQHWKEHLLRLDQLRQVIGLRAYGQRDPLNEYKTEAFNMFSTMLGSLRGTVTTRLAYVVVKYESDDTPALPPAPRPVEMHESHSDPVTGINQVADEELQVLTPGPVMRRNPDIVFDPNDSSTWGRVPRNSPCPCESEKKYKHCHGKS
ncbi:MAG TPA: hypothetical protein EYQ81_10030 [Sneathiellales bacterium]|nr:hypothetical protein [Sneathiellales bacterium]